MSYEPRLIIRRSDLIKHENTFEYEQYDLDKDNAEVSKYLLNIVKGGYIKFKEIELYICQPEFSKFNSDVRDKLIELDVEYKIDN